MTSRSLVSRVLQVAAVAMAVASAADAADSGRQAPAPAAAQPARQGVALPMKGDLRPTLGSAQRNVVPTMSIDTIAKNFNQFSGDAKAFEGMAKAIPEITQQCASKPYSIQEQAKAGCTPTDTVAQCSDKLLKHCLQNFQGTRLPRVRVGSGGAPGHSLPTTGGSNHKIGFSLQEFQQTAAAAAAAARTLSQQLAAYANQIDFNAKKALP